MLYNKWLNLKDQNLRWENVAQKQTKLLEEVLEELATVKDKNESLEQEVRKLKKVQQKGLPRFVHGRTSESGAKGACQEPRVAYLMRSRMRHQKMDAALLGVIFRKIKKHQAWSQDTELSVTQRGKRSKCVRKWCEMIFRGVIVKSVQDNSNECRGHSVRMGKGSWSRRRHMTEAWSSTEAGRRVIRQGENDDVLVQRMHISWGRKTWCGAHLLGEKSTFGMKISRDRDTEADLIERERSSWRCSWVVLKQWLKYLTEKRHKRKVTQENGGKESYVDVTDPCLTDFKFYPQYGGCRELLPRAMPELVNTCKRLILRQSPTAECCLRIRRTPMWCLCSIITPQLAALVNANDVSDAVGVICQ
ncbi:hypothetical protein DY000_02014819 [Brassica cretica]|uniref:Bifunctional inhibitor/plant lipid transfer protein/seed storage helical domain-containing protein n=1 Tax=Brassica cretica TaxID=69181 RepID=A0ABQ7CQL1_BRACR|nr:hypothetical protein DY000_02014819 [Brassica cretica]